MTDTRLIAALIVVASRTAAADGAGPDANEISDRPDCVYMVVPPPPMPTMGLETGVSVLHYTPDGIDDASSKYHLTAPGTQAITMIGWRLRFYGVANAGWYGGFEFDLSHSDGPRVSGTDASARATGTATTMTIDTNGDLAQTKLLIGKRVTIGRLTAAVELAPGLQVATFSTIDAAPWNQSWYLLEAHAKLDLWLSRKTSIGVESSIDTLHTGRTQIALLFGVHFDKH